MISECQSRVAEEYQKCAMELAALANGAEIGSTAARWGSVLGSKSGNSSFEIAPVAMQVAVSDSLEG